MLFRLSPTACLLALGMAGAVFAWTSVASAEESAMRLSSIGYKTERAKKFTVHGEATTYEVRDPATHEIVLSGPVPAGAGVGENLRSVVTISELGEGSYYVNLPGYGNSKVFDVGAQVYNDALLMLMVGYYGWRSGVDVSLMHQGVVFSHVAGHEEDGIVYSTDEPKDGTGGWYDAGDFGKYVVNGAFTVATLLAAWEHFDGNLSQITLPIPESGGPVPDYLAEVKFELDWLLKMQIESGDDAGAVYTKLTPLRFSEFMLPSEDDSLRYFAGHGSPATAVFAAVMAQASRIYRPFDEDFADKAETAAIAAYTWLNENPEFLRGDFEGFRTGDYRGNEDGQPGKKFWAATELWETTGDAAYLADAEAYLAEQSSLVVLSWDWKDLRNMGAYTYALSEREGRNEEIVSFVGSEIKGAAAFIRSEAKVSIYGRAEPNYYWGTNGVTVRHCMTLQVAHRLEANEAYIDACSAQISYLYGRNQYGRSQVTGHGIDAPLLPHHRISASDDVELPYPGLLVGGGTTADNWMDVREDFETNEVAINYSAALVYGLAAFVEGEMIYDGNVGGTAPPVREVELPAGGLPVPAPVEVEPEPAPDVPAEDMEVSDPAEEEDTKPPLTILPEDGCGCRAAGTTGANPWSGLFALGLLGVFLRRRRSAAL